MFKQTQISNIEGYESIELYTVWEVTASYLERLNGCTLKMYDYETQSTGKVSQRSTLRITIETIQDPVVTLCFRNSKPW